MEPLELGGLSDDVEADVLLAAHHSHGDPPPHLQAEQGVDLQKRETSGFGGRNNTEKLQG